MIEKDREDLITKYYQSWVKKDESMLDGVFSDDCIYSECFGEEYRGDRQIHKWFRDWNVKGSITEWSIKRFSHFENRVVVESFFECKVKDLFRCDAISVITFDKNNKIVDVREYWSKFEHHLPYGEK